MEMAKASRADLDMATELCAALDALTGLYPTMPAGIGDEASESPFDRDDPKQCVRALGHLLDIADRASLARVVWGAVVMLDPRNRCVDPDRDVIALHPDSLTGHSARCARPLSEWREDIGAVLWWRQPFSDAPWCGTPNSSGWTGHHTHWTPLIFPHDDSPHSGDIQGADRKS